MGRVLYDRGINYGNTFRQGGVSMKIDYKTHGGFIEALEKSGGSLILSTRPHTLVFVSVISGELKVSHVDLESECTSIAVNKHMLALAVPRGVRVFRGVGAEMAYDYPEVPKTFSQIYVPVRTYHTGDAQWHDLYFAGKRVFGVNSMFSCISEVGYRYHSFHPLWKPPFITDVVPEDRCHLNGASYDILRAEMTSVPRYATALSHTDTRDGWRANPESKGVVMDAVRNRILADDVCVPHSPRDGGRYVYYLESGTGTIWRLDSKTCQKDKVKVLPAFLHGMAIAKGTIFVGMAKERVPRKRAPLPVAKHNKELVAGVSAIGTSGFYGGTLEFTSGVTEVYDVQHIPRVGQVGIIMQTDGQYNAVQLEGKRWWMKATEAS